MSMFMFSRQRHLIAWFGWSIMFSVVKEVFRISENAMVVFLTPTESHIVVMVYSI